MNGKRSYWKLLVAAAGAGLLITNCTVTTSDSGSGGTGSGTCTVGSKITGCTCAGNVVGSQTCLTDGTYGACVCASSETGGSGGSTSATGGGSSAGSAGTGTSTGGSHAGGTSSTGGYAGSAIGAAGEGGAAACDAGIDPTDCYSCLNALCMKQWSACVAETEKTVTQGAPYCMSSMQDGSGQIERVLDCITTERAKGLVKRDVVRACGATVGDSPDPQFFLWAPEEMTQATTDLMNCMADAPGTPTAMAGAWAHPPNISDDENATPLKPWDDCTCAKISCTSGL